MRKIELNRILARATAFLLLCSLIIAILGVGIAYTFIKEEHASALVFVNQIQTAQIDEKFREQPEIEISQHNTKITQDYISRVSFQKQVDKLQRYLYAKNPSVFSNKNIAKIIIQDSARYGANYKVIVAIMGKESGYCRANYKKYNCFGFLNGVQYGSFEAAFRALVPQIAKRAAPFGMNTRGLADVYRPVDRDGWAKRVYGYAIQVP